jgi:hypothetical protein
MGQLAIPFRPGLYHHVANQRTVTSGTVHPFKLVDHCSRLLYSNVKCWGLGNPCTTFSAHERMLRDPALSRDISYIPHSSAIFRTATKGCFVALSTHDGELHRLTERNTLVPTRPLGNTKFACVLSCNLQSQYGQYWEVNGSCTRNV